MPLTQTLTDNFDDGVVDASKWPNNYNTGSGGLPTETGGRARVPCDSGFAAFASDSIYTLEDSYAFVRVFPPPAGGMVDGYCQLIVLSSTAGTQIVFEINPVTNLLLMTVQVGFVDEGGQAIPYDATEHAWLRILEDAGTLHWDTSPDGRTWTTRHTDTSPAWVSDTDLELQLLAHCSPAVTGTPTGEYAEFDDFNIRPVLTDGYTVAIDWNSDGDFNDTNEDVTSDVLSSGVVNFQYGRDQARSLSPPRVGALGFTLCNADGTFSPENPDSPIAEDIAPAAPIKVEEVIDDTLYPLIRGRIDTFDVSTDRGRLSATITGLDGLALLRGTKISTELYQAQRTGTLIGAILDAVGWTAPRDLDLGATHVPWWWASNQDAFELLTQLLSSEGPPAIAYVGPDGTFIYRDRHHRILNAASLTPQAVFSSSLGDCDTGAGEIGHLVGLDSAATTPTDDFATVTVPSDGTVAIGDLLLVGSVMPSGSRTFSISGGAGAWTSLGSAAQSGHTSQLWWRIAETGDLGATITITPSSPNIRQVVLLGSVSNVDSMDPIAGSASLTTVDTTSLTTPTVSDAPSGSREISVLWDSRGGSTPQTSNWAAPVGQTRRIQEFTTALSGASSGAMGDSDSTVSGTAGSRTWTPDQAAIGSAWTIVVRPPLSYLPPFEYEIGWHDIVNSITFPVDERRPAADLSVVWESDTAISLSLGESKTVKVQANEPFRDAQDLIDGTDIVYTGTGVPTVLLSRTSGQSVTITIIAVGGTVNVSHLQLRARSVPVARTVEVSATDSTSATRHGERTYPEDAPWVNQHDAFAVAQLLLAAYAERRPTVGLRIVSSDLAHHLQVVSRQISDLVTIRNGRLRLNADFHIETIGHTLARMAGEDTCPGPVHYATFGCERSGVVVPDNPFTFDKTGAGFDDGVFDPTGFDDPDTVFIFDHATQGQFGTGQFGT